MIKYFKSSELLNYDLSFSNAFPYKNNYKINALLNKKNIIIKTPKVELHSNLNSGYIVINLNNVNKKFTSFIEFIKNIQIQAGDKIKLNLKKKYKLHSNFVGDNTDIKYIFKNCENMIIFDKNKKSIKNSDVEIYSDIILLIKLQDIWINTEKRTYGLNWSIYQCRVFPPFDYMNCILFDSDNEDDSKEPVKTELVVQRCVFCNSVCTYSNTIENINIGKGKGKGKGFTKGKGKGDHNSNITGGRGNIEKKIEIKKDVKKQTNNKPVFNPSADELIAMKNKLKKMTKIVDSDSD